VGNPRRRPRIFDDAKTTINFQGPVQVAYPQSYLIDILRDVQYALPVHRSNFPEQWLCRERQRNDLGGRSAAGGGEGTRGRNASPTKGGYANPGGGGPKRGSTGGAGALMADQEVTEAWEVTETLEGDRQKDPGSTANLAVNI
jgi:hypothetical protein